MDCLEFEKLYWLKVYGETVPGGEDGIAEHLEKCAACRDRKAEIDRMHALLGFRTAQEAKPEALASARRLFSARLKSQLKRSFIDRLGERLKELIDGNLTPAFQPAVALGMLLIGLLIGRLVFFNAQNAPVSPSPPFLSDPISLEHRYISEKVLQHESSITDLRVRPMKDESGLVQVSFRGTQDYIVAGKPEDDLIRELLTWAIKNEENSGARLNSVKELSRASSLSSMTREALAYAAINDANDGVRLKALEALGNAPRDELTEQAMLGALLKDPNPAVRIRAIDLLLSEN